MRSTGVLRRLKYVRVMLVAVVLLAPTILGAVDGDKAQYVGGTVSGLQEKAEAKFVTASEVQLSFDAGKKGTVRIG